MFSTLKKWFIGRPLKSGAEGEGGLLGKMQALAMLSSDALSSIAYGFDADEPSGATRISDIVDDSGLSVHCQYHCLDRLWCDPNLDGSLGL